MCTYYIMKNSNIFQLNFYLKNIFILIKVFKHNKIIQILHEIAYV